MKYLLIISILLLLISCGKERTFHVKAQNPATGEPYDGLRVVVTSSRTAWNGEKYKTEHDGHLDSNGEAMINVKVKTGRTYSVQCEQPPNTCYTKDIQLYLKDHDEQNPSFLFEYAECAYLKLKIENVNCQGPDDKMVLYQGNQIGNFNYDEPWEHNGCATWETNGYSDVPVGEQYYRWEITINGVTEEFHDTLYLEENEYKTYEINYLFEVSTRHIIVNYLKRLRQRTFPAR